MTEIKGYTCDGGCGATTVIDRPAASIAEHGWYTTFTPSGYPTLHTCSMECLISSLRAIGARGLPV